MENLILLQVRFTPWQSIKRIASWLWNNIFETTFYFAGVFAVRQFTFFASKFYGLTIYKTQRSLTLKLYLWNYILFWKRFYGWTVYFFLHVRFAPWQSIKRIAAWLWKFNFEILLILQAFLQLDSLLFFASTF